MRYFKLNQRKSIPRLLAITVITLLTLPVSSWAQSFLDTVHTATKYTFLNGPDSDSIRYPTSIYEPGYFFVSATKFGDSAKTYGFDPNDFNQGYYDLHFEKFTLHSALPPVINDLGEVSALNVVGNDSISVIAHQMENLRYITIHPNPHKRFENYILMSMLPWAIPSLLYFDEPEDMFLTGSLFAALYAPLAITSLGFYDSKALLRYERETFFDVPGEFQISPAISASYVMNQLFKYYRYEDSFRLLPVVGVNTSLIHHISPAQFNLGVYYAFEDAEIESHEDHGSDHLKKKNRILLNAGMNYPLLLTDNLYIDFETGMTATAEKLTSPYLRINWSPRLGGLKRLSISHHLLMGQGFDFGSDGTISGWPLLHFVNFSLIPPTRYELSSMTESTWLVGVGARNVKSVYWYEDYPSEILPSLSLSRRIDNRNLITFESGIGEERTIEKIDYESSRHRRSSITTRQMLFTTMRRERIFQAATMDLMFGGGVIYLVEFREREEIDYEFDTWEETRWYEDQDRTELGFLLTLSASKRINPYLYINAGFDMDGFRVLDTVFDDFEGLGDVISLRAGIKYNFSK